MDASSSISVAVRVRPFSIREAAQLPSSSSPEHQVFVGNGSLAGTPAKLAARGIRRIVQPLDGRVLVFDPPESNPLAKFQKTLHPGGKRVKDLRYAFDKVFDETSSQDEVYMSTTRSLLDSILDGYNATVFAYGATGCGKTHTISGTPQQPGIIFLTMEELFKKVDACSSEKKAELSLSYLEIYNETIRDLLVPRNSTKPLNLREDAEQKISVPGLTIFHPRNVTEVMEMILSGNANRTMSPTEANAVSSRSHAVLQINVSQRDRTANISENHTMATLSIIDLAGSERASATKNRGERLIEGANINRSLLALGNCINALCDHNRKNHIPYRDSKLTRLLKFSLGGNCKTVMIVCVSPSSQHYDETHNTLKYANRAKNIKTKVSRNFVSIDRHVSQYVKAIYDLRQEVEELRKRLESASGDVEQRVRKEASATRVAFQNSLRKIRSSYDHTYDIREQSKLDTKTLNEINHRVTTVGAWIAIFDSTFQGQEQLPNNLLGYRKEAKSILRDLQMKQGSLQHRLQQSLFISVFSQAVQGVIRAAKMEGNLSEDDIQNLKSEAEKLQALAAKEALENSIGAANDERTTLDTTLIKNQLQVIRFIACMDTPQLPENREEILNACILSISQLSVNNPSLHVLTRNNSQCASSPVPPSLRAKSVSSPTRANSSSGKSPRPNFRSKSPFKSQVNFGRKRSPSKKRVRWGDETNDGKAPGIASDAESSRNEFMRPGYLAQKQSEPLSNLESSETNQRPRRDETSSDEDFESVCSEDTEFQSKPCVAKKNSQTSNRSKRSPKFRAANRSSLDDYPSHRSRQDKENMPGCMSPRFKSSRRMTVNGLQSGSLRIANPAALIKEFSKREDIIKADSSRLNRPGWR